MWNHSTTLLYDRENYFIVISGLIFNLHCKLTSARSQFSQSYTCDKWAILWRLEQLGIYTTRADIYTSNCTRLKGHAILREFSLQKSQNIVLAYSYYRRFSLGRFVVPLQTTWYSLESCSFIHLKVIYSYTRNYLKIWKEEFSRVSSHGLK